MYHRTPGPTAIILVFVAAVAILIPTALAAQVPRISSITPSSGPPGTPVTIAGLGFDPVPDSNAVYFGTLRAAIQSADSNIIHVTAPAGAVYAPITVLTHGLSAAYPHPFDITFPTAGVLDNQSFGSRLVLQSGVFPSEGLALGDLDGDGRLDIVICNGGVSSLYIFRGSGHPGPLSDSSFDAPYVITASNQPFKVVLVDLDGDGRQDIAVVNKNYGAGTTFTVYRNTSTPGALSFEPAVTFPVPPGPNCIDAADLNGDGKPDIAVVSQWTDSLALYRNTSAPGIISFADRVTYGTGAGCYGLAIADLDGDGKPDIAAANGSANSISVFRNISTPDSLAFAPRVDYAEGPIPDAVIDVDVNLDGKPDLVCVNYLDNTVAVLRNTSVPGGFTAGSFAPPVLFTTGQTPRTIAAGDVDGDGKPDLVVPNYYDSTITILRNVSRGDTVAFMPGISLFSGQNPFSTAVGDLDGDGRPEIVSGNNQGCNLSVFRNLLGDVHPIIASAGFHGNISPAGRTDVLHQANMSFNIIPDSGYTIADVLIDSGSAGPVAAYEFHHVIAPHSITAEFLPQTFVITASAGLHGTINPGGSQTVMYDSSISFRILPDPGYGIDSLIVDDLPFVTDTILSFTRVRQNHSVRVVFTASIVTVMIRADHDSAALTIDGERRYGLQTRVWRAGSTHSIAADSISLIAPGTRLIWNGWSDGGGRVHAITPPADTMYTSYFRMQYLLTLTAGAGGTTAQSSSYRDSAATDSIRAIPAEGHHFTRWSGSGHGAYTGAANPAIVAMHGPVTDTAFFAPDTEIISAAAGRHGRVTPSGNVQVVYGTDQTFSIVPDSGWVIDSIIVDGGATGDSSGSYTFRDVRTGHRLEVTFSATGTVGAVIHTGWNMVSVPVIPPMGLKDSIFPGSISRAFAYAGTYRVIDTLSTGIGYWIKYPPAGRISVTGRILTSMAVGVQKGWNIIGSLSTPIPASAIGIVPAGCSTSKLFGFNGNYFIADTLYPCMGYWIKVGDTATLLLGELALSAARRTTIVEYPPGPPGEDVDASSSFPTETMLEENFPNPFNPSTHVSFEIRESRFVLLKIYDVLGKEVAVLVDEKKEPGRYLVEWNAANYPGGVYFCRMQAGAFVQTRKMLVVK